jgi:predicted transglutaminase-like cysteine proteinase
MRKIGLGLAMILACLSGLPANARNGTNNHAVLAALPAPSPLAATAEDSRAPIGWVQLCRDNPGECQLNPREADRVTLTPGLWRRLQSVNLSVNKAIKPVTDEDHWGVTEHWGLPTDGRGDCEDYALEKRRQLVEGGLPRRALLMTVVIDETGGGHAILTVRTDRGDFILDNKRNAVMSWEATGYRFIKRESQTRVGWVTMNVPDRPMTITAGQ